MTSSATAPTGDHTVADILATRRVVVCVGSGGVGKTTTAAALALHAAREGRRALVITIDPARRLANALGLKALGAVPQPVAREVLQIAGIDEGAHLDAMTLDLTHAWDDLIRRTAPDEAVAKRIISAPLYQALSRDLPGAQEFIACEALHVLLESGVHDVVVLDTPPTANALDFLDAPNRILDMLDSDAMRLFAASEPGAAARLGLRFLDGAKGVVFSALSRFTGTEFLDELGAFLSLFRDLYQPIRDRTRSLQDLLRSDDARFLIITSPNSAPLGEAIAFFHMLQERQLPVGALIANRVMPEPPSALPRTEAAMASALAGLGTREDEVAQLAAVAKQASAEQAAVALADLEALERARAEIGARLPLLVVPRLHGDVGDAQRLTQLLPWLLGERTA